MVMAFFFSCFLIQLNFIIITSLTSYPCSSNSSCGCSLNPVTSTKIIGGEAVQTDSWSWAVSIRSQNNHICGGSLIAPDLVLTAAHCVYTSRRGSSTSVTAGSRYLSIINQQRSVAEIAIHRNYDVNTYANDIAVLRLSSPFDMNDRLLALICLPSNQIDYPSNSFTTVAVGWGVLSMKDKRISNVLQQVTLQTIPTTVDMCQRSIRNEELQFCAGVSGGGKDTCQGDSGGPLMMFSNQRWYLIGITSYGVDCALAQYAGVYTRVSNYTTLISCFLKKDELCIEKMFIVKNSVSFLMTSFYRNCFSIVLLSIIIPVLF